MGRNVRFHLDCVAYISKNDFLYNFNLYVTSLLDFESFFQFKLRANRHKSLCNSTLAH